MTIPLPVALVTIRIFYTIPVPAAAPAAASGDASIVLPRPGARTPRRSGGRPPRGWLHYAAPGCARAPGQVPAAVGSARGDGWDFGCSSGSAPAVGFGDVGAVGMCFTGGFALAMAVDDR